MKEPMKNKWYLIHRIFRMDETIFLFHLQKIK